MFSKYILIYVEKKINVSSCLLRCHLLRNLSIFAVNPVCQISGPSDQFILPRTGLTLITDCGPIHYWFNFCYFIYSLIILDTL